MSFELSPHESFAAGIHRTIREGLDHMRAVLSAGESGARPAPEAVHAARKEIKKARALLRLARTGLGETTFKRENQCYRDIGRALSTARDAAVLVRAFDDLRSELYGLTSPETIAGVQGRLEHAVRESEDRLELPQVIDTLRAARDRAEDWPWLEDLDAWRVPEKGLCRIYRQGRRALRRSAGEHPAENDFHEWRKQVKNLATALMFLAPIHPKHLAATVRKLDRLAQMLGDEHDLFVLAETIDVGPEGHLQSAVEVATVRRAIEERRRGLQRKALKHGRPLYKEKPEAFAARLKADWKQWRRHSV